MRNTLLQSIVISSIISAAFVFGTPQMAFAQVDIIIDLDGNLTTGPGGPADQEVMPGSPLTAWPAPPGPGLPPASDRAGIDWLDRNQTFVSKTWNDGDSLFSEDPNACTNSNRDQRYNTNVDCIILEGPLGPIPNNLLTDCDLETGTSPSGLFAPATECQDVRPNVKLTFFDTDKNGVWSFGEDIVLDANGDGIFLSGSVGGELIPIETSMVYLAGVQTTTSWLIPIIISGFGFGFVIVRSFLNKK